MQVPMLRQAACCHGAAILDKPQRQAVRCINYGKPWN